MISFLIFLLISRKDHEGSRDMMIELHLVVQMRYENASLFPVWLVRAREMSHTWDLELEYGGIRQIPIMHGWLARS